MEGSTADLGGVGEHVDVPAALPHQLLEPRLPEVGLTDPALGVHAVRAQERAVEAHPVQRALRDRPHQRLADRTERPAEAVHGRAAVRAVQLAEDGQAGRRDREVGAVAQPVRQCGHRRPGVEHHRIAGLDLLGGPPGDGELLGERLAEPLLERRLAVRGRHHRSAVGAREPSGRLELREVAPDRRRRHREVLRHRGDAGQPAGLGEADDLGAALT